MKLLFIAIAALILCQCSKPADRVTSITNVVYVDTVKADTTSKVGVVVDIYNITDSTTTYRAFVDYNLVKVLYAKRNTMSVQVWTIRDTVYAPAGSLVTLGHWSWGTYKDTTFRCVAGLRISMANN